MNIIEKLKSEIKNKEYYDKGLLSYIDFSNTHRWVDKNMSFDDWSKNFSNISTNIHIGSLHIHSLYKNEYKEMYKNIDFKDIDLFYNLKGGFSFREHTDNCNVYLHVLKGFKIVHMLNSTFMIKENESIIIQKNTLHKVESLPETWGLSIGF